MRRRVVVRRNKRRFSGEPIWKMAGDLLVSGEDEIDGFGLGLGI